MSFILEPNLPPITIVDWFIEQGIDCDEHGIVHTRFGNQINLIELLANWSNEINKPRLIETP